MKSYSRLWLLLAISFILFFVYSMCGQISVCGYEIRTNKLSQSIIAQVDTNLIKVRDDIPEKVVPKFPVPVDTAKKVILFVGDSMLDGLYPRLAAYAKENGHEMYAVIWYSSSTERWGKKHRLTEYINSLNPSYIFVCLGSNELIVKDIKEKRTKYVKSMLAEIDTIPFVWIGPPNWKEDTGINEMLAENLPEGTFFVSNGMKFDRKKDGAHPTRESAAKWMDSVVRWMPEHCLHPIVLNKPEADKARAKRVFVHQPGEE